MIQKSENRQAVAAIFGPYYEQLSQPLNVSAINAIADNLEALGITPEIQAFHSIVDRMLLNHRERNIQQLFPEAFFIALRNGELLDGKHVEQLGVQYIFGHGKISFVIYTLEYASKTLHIGGNMVSGYYVITPADYSFLQGSVDSSSESKHGDFAQ